MDNTKRIYDGTNKPFSCLSDDFYEKYKTNGKFHLFKGYLPNDDDLVRFYNDFTDWCNETSSGKHYPRITYNNYYNHSTAVICVFKRLCKNYEKMPNFSFTEYQWYLLTNNGGLTYCIEEGIYESFGNDFSCFYPRILASENFFIPNCEGEEKILDKLPDKLQFGIYKVKITCNDKNFHKIFAFSKENAYASLSLQDARKHQKEFNVNIELIQNGKPNCLVYDKIIKGKEIFGIWFEKLYALKLKYPKNKLIKHLMSSLWANLNE
eukprot:gene14303-19184_t